MNFQDKSTSELESELQRKIDEVYRIRRELDRRKGDVPGVRHDVDFEQYVKE